MIFSILSKKYNFDLHAINEEKESIEIFHSIAERIHAFKCQVNQNEILKQCEEKFNSLNLNEESVSQLCEFSNATDQKSNNSIEKVYIVKAYYLSLFMYRKINEFIRHFRKNKIVLCCLTNDLTFLISVLFNWIKLK